MQQYVVIVSDYLCVRVVDASWLKSQFLSQLCREEVEL